MVGKVADLSLVSPAVKASGREAYSAAYRRYVLVVFMLCNSCSFIDRQILTILLVPIKAEFHLTDTELGFLSGVSFALFFAVMGIPIGWLADRTNRRNLMTGALTVFSAMTVLSGISPSFWPMAAARMGVGVGEAGITPSVHSMTSDMFPTKERASALSWYAAGINIGSGLGLLLGGWITQWFGWRAAFFCAGVPGLILATIVRFTIREPVRGAADGPERRKDAAPVGLVQGIRFMWSQPAFRHLAMAGGLASLVGNGVLAFLPTFLSRSFGVSSGAVGTTVALIMTVAGGLGTLASGRIVDHFMKRDVRAGLNVEAIAYVLAAPTLAVVFLQPGFASVLACFIPSAFVYAFFMGPTCSFVQSLAPTRMRASASAFLFLIFAVLGNGVGPQLAGILSDAYTPVFGADALRYALMTLSLIYLWAAAHFLWARRTFKQGIDRALATD